MRNLIILGIVLLTACNRNIDRTKSETLEAPESFINIDTIKPGKGIGQIVIGQNVKTIIREVGTPTEIFSRHESIGDTIFHPVRDTSVFLPYYFHLDTAYHFRDVNRYGLAHVYSKNGIALLLGFSYIFDDDATFSMVNGDIGFFDQTEKVKSAFKQAPVHFVPTDDALLKDFGIREDKVEDLYYFDQGIHFGIYKGQMISFTIHPPMDNKQLGEFVNALKLK